MNESRHPFLSIIIPAYNEETRIAKTLASVMAYLETQSYTWEIIVANDGSRDHTVDVVRSLQQVRVMALIDNKQNRGKGFVVRQGMAAAQGDIALFMDADNSTHIKEIEKMLPLFKRGYDIVIGSRRMPQSQIVLHQPWYREILGKISSVFARVLFGFSYMDTQAGFKAFSKKGREVFLNQRIYGWAFDIELLACAGKLGLRVGEVPISWHNDADSRVTFDRAIATIFDVIRIRIRL